jgi:hypothetical protein
MVNAVVPPPVSREKAYLSLGSGQRLWAPANLPPARLIPLSGAGREGTPDPTRVVVGRSAYYPTFLQMLGANAPGRTPGALGAACRAAKKKVAYLGLLEEGRIVTGPGFLCAMDEEGAVPLIAGPSFPPREADGWAPFAEALLRRHGADLLVVDLPRRTGSAEALGVAEGLSKLLDPARDLLVLTSPDPGAPKDGQWRFLSPALLWGQGWGGGLARSTTTRTDGLLANVDLAPTLLARLGVAVPPEMEGHPARPGRGSLPELAGLARHTRVTREVMIPLLLAWGAVALVSVLWATLALLSGRDASRLKSARLLLALAAAFPPAMLLAAWLPAASSVDLAARIVLIGIALAALAALGARGRSPVMGVFVLTTGIVLADLFTGCRMLQRNLMSDFVNSGVRFYGIGNEYEGLLLGSIVLIPFWAEHLRGRDGPEARLSSAGWVLAAALWTLALVGVAAPALGADFGGGLSFAITFLAAGCLAARFRPRPWQVALGGLLVLGVAGALVAADLARPPGSRTHVGELAAKALEHGGGVVLEVAARKVKMNVRMALTPYFLGGIAAVTPLLFLWVQKLGRTAAQTLAGRSLLRGGALCTFVGGLATLVLNDSGVVAWALATGCGLFFLLDLLLDPSLASRTVPPDPPVMASGAAPSPPMRRGAGSEGKASSPAPRQGKPRRGRPRRCTPRTAPGG